MLDAEIVLREYRDADLEEISRLDEACFSKEFRFDRRSMRSFAEARGAIAVVAEADGGGDAGFVVVHVGRSAGRGSRDGGALGVAARIMRQGVASPRSVGVGGRC